MKLPNGSFSFFTLAFGFESIIAILVFFMYPSERMTSVATLADITYEYEVFAGELEKVFNMMMTDPYFDKVVCSIMLRKIFDDIENLIGLSRGNLWVVEIVPIDWQHLPIQQKVTDIESEYNILTRVASLCV